MNDEEDDTFLKRLFTQCDVMRDLHLRDDGLVYLRLGRKEFFLSRNEARRIGWALLGATKYDD